MALEVDIQINTEKEFEDNPFVFSTLFFSFDIVRSTEYKNVVLDNSLKVIKNILDKIEELFVNNFEGIKFWRTTGDEIILYLEVYREDEIYDAVDKAFSILNQVRNKILNLEIDGREESKRHQNLISLKASSWLALVSEDADDKNILNKKYLSGMLKNDGRLDFQGPDIDTGFRVTKHTADRRLAVSYELALILSEKVDYNKRLKLIGFKSLKGVWSNRKYPIIWYHNKNAVDCENSELKLEIEKFEDSFFYDEEDYCEITKKYLEKKNVLNKEDIREVLKKIEKDLSLTTLNVTRKVFNIKRAISELEGKKRSYIKGSDRETHCVAVCRSNNEILIFKKSDKDFYDFGCVKINVSEDKRIEDILKEQYEKEFNIKIDVKNPFRTYYFEKKGRLVTGFRFLADILEVPEEQELNSEEYDSFKFVNKTNYVEEAYREQDEFLGIFSELFEEK